MEPEEISIVLSRASELHAKFSDAIERVIKIEFLLTSNARRNGSPSDAGPLPAVGAAAASSADGAAVLSPPAPAPVDIAPGSEPNGPSQQSGKSQNAAGRGVGFETPREVDGTTEVRSLASIRDALEGLEERLEALQVLQQHQRVERDAGLAEIEESRRILLNRLREHRGRELEVVQEALAFAGEAVSDKDDLPLPPYPMLIDGQSPQFRPVPLSLPRSGPVRRLNMVEEQPDKSEVLDLDIGGEDEEEERSGVDQQFQSEEEKESANLLGVAINAIKNSGALEYAQNAVKNSAAMLAKFREQITWQLTGQTSKVVLVVVSMFALASLTDIGQRRKRSRKSVSRVSKAPASRSPHHLDQSNNEKGSAHRSPHHPHQSIDEKGSAHRSPHHPESINETGPIKEEHTRHFVGRLTPTADQFTDHATVAETPAYEGKATQTKIVEETRDFFPRCIVRERLEVPFYHELRTPDVLNGRG